MSRARDVLALATLTLVGAAVARYVICVPALGHIRSPRAMTAELMRSRIPPVCVS